MMESKYHYIHIKKVMVLKYLEKQSSKIFVRKKVETSAKIDYIKIIK